MTTAIKINSNNWTQFSAQGYVQVHNLQVRELDDGTVRIGGGRYRRDELIVTTDDSGKPCRIDHAAGAWYLER